MKESAFNGERIQEISGLIQTSFKNTSANTLYQLNIKILLHISNNFNCITDKMADSFVRSKIQQLRVSKIVSYIYIYAPLFSSIFVCIDYTHVTHTSYFMSFMSFTLLENILRLV